MKFKIDQSRWNTEKENFISVDDLSKNLGYSQIFRNFLCSRGYTKFDGKKLKGDFCYDAYYKDFFEDSDLKYTIYCYCYDLKGLVETPEVLEFSLEVQIESLEGVISFETTQWDFRIKYEAERKMEYFEKSCDDIWKIFGSKKFRT
jgi:hypothetical protein